MVLLTKLIIHDTTWKDCLASRQDSLIQVWPVVRDLLTVETLQPVNYSRPPDRPNTPDHQEFPGPKGKERNTKIKETPAITAAQQWLNEQ